jgi:TMEM175 potassium channel family protein
VPPAGPRRYPRLSNELEFNRVANLSDGVFAIAMTLLVVTVGSPAASDARIGAELERLLPEIGAFFLSFVVIGSYWLAHHQFVSLLTAFNARLLTWNLFYLALIAFLPFTTNVLGEHEGVALVVAIYALNVATISGLETVMFVVAHRSGLFERPLPPDVYRFAVLESVVPVVAFVVSVPLAWIHVGLAAVCWAALIPVGPLLRRRRPADANLYLD